MYILTSVVILAVALLLYFAKNSFKDDTLKRLSEIAQIMALPLSILFFIVQFYSPVKPLVQLVLLSETTAPIGIPTPPITPRSSLTPLATPLTTFKPAPTPASTSSLAPVSPEADAVAQLGTPSASTLAGESETITSSSPLISLRITPLDELIRTLSYQAYLAFLIGLGVTSIVLGVGLWMRTLNPWKSETIGISVSVVTLLIVSIALGFFLHHIGWAIWWAILAGYIVFGLFLSVARFEERLQKGILGLTIGYLIGVGLISFYLAYSGSFESELMVICFIGGGMLGFAIGLVK